MNLSYWERKYFWNDKDFIVIGSGITGLTAAIELKNLNPKSSVLVIEKGLLPSGASTKNAGFACFGSSSEILADLETMSEKVVFSLVEKRYRGLQNLIQLLGAANINYEHNGGYELFTQADMELYRDCLGSLGYLNAEMVQAVGKQVYWDAEKEIKGFGLNVAQMIRNTEEGQIDTGLMMKALLKLAAEKGVEILNNIDVLNWNETADFIELDTSFGKIRAARVLIATNGFAKKLLPQLDVAPARAQVLITKPVKNLKINACFHYDRGYYYFRNLHGRILFGGGRNLNLEGENTYEFGLTDQIQSQLERILREVILPDQDFEVEQRWSGIMGVGKSKEIILQTIGNRAVCAVRLGGMGIAIGSILGKEAAEMLSEKVITA